VALDRLSRGVRPSGVVIHSGVDSSDPWRTYPMGVIMAITHVFIVKLLCQAAMGRVPARVSAVLSRIKWYHYLRILTLGSLCPVLATPRRGYRGPGCMLN
jgi:hypothetical protein